MNTTSQIINPFLIKDAFSEYTDPSSFSNYQKIARDYYKLYHKLLKKLTSLQGDQLRTKVKAWLFNNSLESQMKICTVENEFYCQIIYQMYLYTRLDKNVQFSPKPNLTDIYELNSNNIYKQFMNETSQLEFKLETYFGTKSDTYSSEFNVFSMLENGLYGQNQREKNYNSNIDECINEIKFYSVHHKPYPDCFCLDPCFLLKKEKFDATFNFMGHTNYFKKFIEPFCNQEKNIYGYCLPDWFTESTNYNLTQYIFAFIEQSIMVKYLLNNFFINKKSGGGKNSENEMIFSLINDENLNRIYLDRKTVINYFNITYNDFNSKKKLIDDTDMTQFFEKILKNNTINSKIIYYKNFRRNYNYNGTRGAMLIEPLLGINSDNYIYNPLYDNMRNFLCYNPDEQSNYIINKIRSKLLDAIEYRDNIIFVDFLLYENIGNLWEYDYFIYFEIIEYFINFINEQNYKDLLLDEDTPTKKKKRKKKKKKQNNNNEINDEINNNNASNNSDNKNEKKKKPTLSDIEMECYKELLKDEEKILYATYYLSTDFEMNKKFKKMKNNKIKSITKKNKEQDIKEIYNYIRNEFLLKYIINKVIHLQPDNYVKFFDINENKNNKEEKIKGTNIKGLKLTKKNKKKDSDDNLGFITINFNLNDKKICDKNEINENEDEANNKNEINININNKNNNILNEKHEIKINNINNNFSSEKSEINEINITKKSEININMNENNSKKVNKIKSSSNQRSNSNEGSNSRKRQKKSFFLFDTVKAKSKNEIKSKSPNNSKQSLNKGETTNSINIKILKIKNSNNNLSFYEKLHNNILKNEKKVEIILQSLTKFKNYCIEKIKKIIIKTYNNDNSQNNFFNYSIDLYGSYTTNLMIEASDIDIKIKMNNLNKGQFNEHFMNLYNKLNDEKKFEKITPISTASVPVIKLIIDIEKFCGDNKDLIEDFSKFKQQNFFKNYIFDINELTQIRIDITFIVSYSNLNIINKDIKNKIENDNINMNINSNNNDSEKSIVPYIKEQLNIYPEIKPILILLKRYFYIKNMNSSFVGGLSSYNLFLLILSYSKYTNITQNKIDNLGDFLIQFLSFFGQIFDFKNSTVNINSPCIYEPNNSINYNSGKTLTILDPLTGLNASKSSYKIFEIQKMFYNAYNFFEKERILYENNIYKNEINDKRVNDKNEGILGLNKIHKNEYSKKNNKENKINTNIIDKFFFS